LWELRDQKNPRTAPTNKIPGVLCPLREVDLSSSDKLAEKIINQHRTKTNLDECRRQLESTHIDDSIVTEIISTETYQK
jgi:SOS response regulatory protein OraA/RecX